jgi:hypothetical protein
MFWLHSHWFATRFRELAATLPMARNTKIGAAPDVDWRPAPNNRHINANSAPQLFNEL